MVWFAFHLPKIRTRFAKFANQRYGACGQHSVTHEPNQTSTTPYLTRAFKQERGATENLALPPGRQFDQCLIDGQE